MIKSRVPLFPPLHARKVHLSYAGPSASVAISTSSPTIAVHISRGRNQDPGSEEAVEHQPEDSPMSAPGAIARISTTHVAPSMIKRCPIASTPRGRAWPSGIHAGKISAVEAGPVSPSAPLHAGQCQPLAKLFPVFLFLQDFSRRCIKSCRINLSME